MSSSGKYCGFIFFFSYMPGASGLLLRFFWSDREEFGVGVFWGVNMGIWPGVFLKGEVGVNGYHVKIFSLMLY